MTPVKKRTAERPTEIHALKVHQWLPQWDEVEFDEAVDREKPPSFFYLFSISAPTLRALSGVHPRVAKDGAHRTEDKGIQRRHDPKRSHEITEYVQYGYPCSTLSPRKRSSDLFKPGWLPGSIVVNILDPKKKRRRKSISQGDAITIKDGSGTASIHLPNNYTGIKWEPKSLYPIEVIDGQHRLWAFSSGADFQDYHLPVVAFFGLDISWQAYLFWTINIKPKRINASLAYDMYPLLRTEDWLEKFAGPVTYREARAQELTENLWSHPKSPWHKWINMLGESGQRPKRVTQAAWIRTLLATFVKAYEGRRVQIGGLFGAPVGSDELVLDWNRSQQAAFLIVMGEELRAAIKANRGEPAESLRDNEELEAHRDPVFYGSTTLLNTDQGIRGVLFVANDLCYLSADKLALHAWNVSDRRTTNDDEAIDWAIRSLKSKKKIHQFLKELARMLAKFDWRTSATPGLSDQEVLEKSVFRGGTGYKQIRLQLLGHLTNGPALVAEPAAEALEKL